MSLVNSTPRVIAHGIRDILPQLTGQPEALPTHYPLQFIFAAQGPEEPQSVIGTDLVQLYGEDSFDFSKPFANHSTAMCLTFNKLANAQMVQRLVPDDANPRANVRLYADVLERDIPEYERNVDGSIKYDATTNAPVTTGNKIKGYEVRWTTKYITSTPMMITLPNGDTILSYKDGESNIGKGTIGPGEMIDPDSGEVSKLYPIMDTEYTWIGSRGNNFGYSIWAPTEQSSTPIDDTLLTDKRYKTYPLRMSIWQRSDEASTPGVVRTVWNESYTDVSFNPNAFNERVNKKAYIGNNFIEMYQDTDESFAIPKYAPFNRPYLYQSNIDMLLKMFYMAEADYIDGFSDFEGPDNGDEFYRFNMLSGVSSKGVPYHSFIINTTAPNSVRLTEKNVIYTRNGSDGTMNTDTFNMLVKRKMEEWGDPDSPYQDWAKYPVSCVYDSGYALDTKYALMKIIGVRKDVWVALTTHTDGETLTASEDSSVGLALKNRIEMYPESEIYGTGVCRGIIIMRDGEKKSTAYRNRLPLIFDIAEKASKYMGASNGRWKSQYRFDKYPGNLVDDFQNVNVTFTPMRVRNKDWSNGLNYVQHYSRRELFWPGLRTVYSDDRSVLTSFITMALAVELQKVGDRVWRMHTGSQRLTEGQFIASVNKAVRDQTENRFDDCAVIVPNAYITAVDKNLGYQWTLDIGMGTDTMKTVQNLSIVAQRRDDMLTTTE